MKTELPSSTSTRAIAGKYLVFRLGRESYGVGVLKIREIMRYQEVTSIPQLPSFIKGVVNLRGKVIPIIDLRARLGLPEADIAERTCIVVVQIDSLSGALIQMGLVVDAVEEVLMISQAEIENAPDFGRGLSVDYILGMAKIKGSVKTLLDIDRVVTAETLEYLHEAVR
jgi:purine-binding chemotaxis protein CheW